MVKGSVLLASRMMNLRANASSAISMTVRSWMMLSCRCSTLMIEWLNSRAIRTVKIMPKTAWKMLCSAGSSRPKITSSTDSEAEVDHGRDDDQPNEAGQDHHHDLLKALVEAQARPSLACLPQRVRRRREMPGEREAALGPAQVLVRLDRWSFHECASVLAICDPATERSGREKAECYPPSFAQVRPFGAYSLPRESLKASQCCLCNAQRNRLPRDAD